MINRKKPTTLNIRMSISMKEALRAIATNERRSVANMVEILIRDYYERHGREIFDQDKEPVVHKVTLAEWIDQ